jgi:hypothetical protein
MLTCATNKTIQDLSVLNVFNQFSFWDAVPLNGSATYAEIAAKVGLHESYVRRLLRHAVTKRIFAETAEGRIVHTSLSAVCVNTPLVRSRIGHNLEVIGPSSQYLPDALRKWGRGAVEDGKPDHSAFGLAFLQNHTAKTFWDWAVTDKDEERGLPAGWRAKRFGEAMTSVTSDPSFDFRAVHAMFGWDSLPQGATLVDVSS